MSATSNVIDNPFADPADALHQNRQPATTTESTRIDTAALGDYNPFETGDTSLTGRISANPEFPPPYSTLEAQLATTAELERRQKELDNKAAELVRREEEQNRLMEQSRRSTGPMKNWPPLPSFFPCGPCFYQDVELEILPEYQKIVYFGYYLWLFYACLLSVNLLVALIYFAGTGHSDGGNLFGVSIVVFVFCVPASYVCWFRPLYKAFRSNSSINFFIFFFVFGAQIVVMGIQSIGITSWGSCGWLTGLAAVKGNPVIGGMVLILAILFTGVTGVCSLYLIRVHRIYRSTGASFGRAREEFARGVVSDPTVRAAVGSSFSGNR